MHKLIRPIHYPKISQYNDSHGITGLTISISECQEKIPDKYVIVGTIEKLLGQILINGLNVVSTTLSCIKLLCDVLIVL